MQHQSYEHVERLAKLRHAELIAAGEERRRAAAHADPVATDTGKAVLPRRRARRIVVAGAMTAAALTAGTAYAVIAASETPASTEPADSLVVNRFLRAV